MQNKLRQATVSRYIITVDLTRFRKDTKFENQEIEIINQDCTINKISTLINTIPYEILTNLGKRYQRRYIT